MFVTQENNLIHYVIAMLNREKLKNCVKLTSVLLKVAIPVLSSVDIWDWSNMGVWRTSITSRPVELIRGDLHQANHVTVVSVVECNHFAGTRLCSKVLINCIFEKDIYCPIAVTCRQSK